MRKLTLILSVILITGLSQSFTTIPESKGVPNDEMITQINDLTASVQNATMDLFAPAPIPAYSWKLVFEYTNYCWQGGSITVYFNDMAEFYPKVEYYGCMLFGEWCCKHYHWYSWSDSQQCYVEGYDSPRNPECIIAS